MTFEDISGLKEHPAAELFPLFAEQELQDLAEDIKKNGLLEPIALLDGMILDGRNRLRACKMAGIEPKFISVNGNCPSPVSYVASKNLHRRHLTTGQRAAIAVEAKALLTEEAKNRSLQNLKHVASSSTRASMGANAPIDENSLGRVNEIVAKDFQIHPATVKRATQVKQHDPATFSEMKAGRITLEDARRKIGVRKPSRPTSTHARVPVNGHNKSGRTPEHGSTNWIAAVVERYDNLRAEITRRRKENHDDRQKRRWNPEDIIKRFQSELLDWIEQELDAVSKLTTGRGR